MSRKKKNGNQNTVQKEIKKINEESFLKEKYYLDDGLTPEERLSLYQNQTKKAGKKRKCKKCKYQESGECYSFYCEVTSNRLRRLALLLSTAALAVSCIKDFIL